MLRSIQRTNRDNRDVLSSLENLIKSWQIGNRQINLLKENNILIYEVFEDCVLKRKDHISPDLIKLYGMTRALKLIDIFYDVIKINLSNHISSQAFLPVLCTDGFIEKREDNKKYHEATNLQIALFGQLSLEDTSRKVIGAIWGIFNPIGKKTNCVQVDDRNFEVVSSFLLNVPLRLGEAKYAEYVKRFKPIFTDNEATCIFLRCVSIYNSNVTLDENNWSITVLSADHRSGFSNVGFSSSNCGHSMLAIESIENRDLFIRYAHITTKRIDGFDDDRKPNQARVEIIKDKIINRVSPGITLRLPKDRVIRLLEYIEDAQNERRYVNFAMDRNIASLVASAIAAGIAQGVSEFFSQSTVLTMSSRLIMSPALIASLSGIEGFILIMSTGIFAIYQPDGMGRIRNRFHNCTSWVIEQLEKIRVEFPLTRRQKMLMTPNGLIESVPQKHREISHEIKQSV